MHKLLANSSRVVRCSASSPHEPPSNQMTRRSMLLAAPLFTIAMRPLNSRADEAAQDTSAPSTTSSNSSSSSSSSSTRFPTGTPYLDSEAQAAVDAALDMHVTKQKAPVLVRLVFHDCGTYDAAEKNGGSNGSIRFELDRPENKGLKRGLGVIDNCMNALKGTKAESLVSYADMIVLASARAIKITGGPDIKVTAGRVDATGPDPEGRLPSENASPSVLKENFAKKGFSAQEMLVLSGAHTLGSKGFGDPVVFDNTYFKTLLEAPWARPGADEMTKMIGLPSDQNLPLDADLRPLIEKYASDQDKFFVDFAAAFIKMSRLGATWQVQPTAPPLLVPLLTI